MPLESTPCTRVMYHAHIEQQSKISATEEIVMMKLYHSEERKSDLRDAVDVVFQTHEGLGGGQLEGVTWW